MTRNPPLHFSPAWSAAVGAALAFYPGPASPGPSGSGPALLGALCAAAFGMALLGAAREGADPPRAPSAARPRSRGGAARLRGIIALSFASGLALGASVREAEAGGPLFPAPTGSRLGITGVAGRLLADPGPASGGWTTAPLAAERVFLNGTGIAGETGAAGSIRILVRGPLSLLAGDRLSVKGRLATGEGGPALFGEAAAVLALEDPGPLARFRRVLRGGFIAGLRAAAGADRAAVGGTGFGIAQRVFSALAGGTATDGIAQRATDAGAAPPTEAAAGLLVALLTGSRDGLDLEDAAAFKAAGCAHVLALSGQHLALLAAISAFLLGPLVGPRRGRVLALGLAWLFVFVAGPGPSLLRSLIMYAIATAALLLDRPAEGRTVLGLSFLVQLVLDPPSARGLGFTLSYLAVGGLVTLAPVIEGLCVRFLPPKAAAALAATLAAQCATNPLLVASFGFLQPAGIPATLASAPLVAAFMAWGLGAGMLCSFVPALGTLAAPVSMLLYRGLSGIMAWFARWPPIAFGSGAGTLAACCVVVGLAAFVYALPHARERSFRRRFRAGRHAGERRVWGRRSPGPQAPRFQLAHRPPRIPGPRGPRDVQALRPELPREPRGA